MDEFVHLSPVILTDDLYFANIGSPLYTGTAVQRQVAYLAAEQAMIRELQTTLLPTSMSGTFLWPSLYGWDGYTQGDNTIKLPFKWVRSIDAVTVLDITGTGTCGLNATDGCAIIRDSIGYIDVFCVGDLIRNQCSRLAWSPYQVMIQYTVGLLTGTAANDTSLHLALSMIAEEVLNEIIDPGANPGGPGAPGVVGYSIKNYSETPNPESLKMTSAGASARMNRAMRLVRHLKKKRAMKFG